MALLYYFLRDRTILKLLFIVNVLGTVYGYIWYQYQLVETEPQFLLFVPDSPTASLFFVFVLLAFLLHKNWGLVEAFAVVTLFKYGIWAVVMNLLLLLVEGDLHWTGYMLMLSHGAMAVQGLLYAPFYRIKGWHLAMAAIWTLHNDVIDYVFRQMPRYGVLDMYYQPIGYFTFWLSILSILIAYVYGMKKKRMSL
ncbi:DUF1405 domain-containing protein [Ectobacillus sp. JY-23]|uniref:DUF1405 domain-containing protein n=1 Tax=Ectobacillus sp. JY-23 TaxID=2933872 RepID=UPI001FF39046|nr:DUF1405 domain-containing protein [Ectobacillus sp. JY-23]UOY93457.1 DUF1405 domain-containing protein [Ectobacillus sp. JY-23]